MMTGVETAGLVLASFPILIKTIHAYQKGFEPLRDLWSFRSSALPKILRRVRTQEIFVQDEVRSLLRYVLDDNDVINRVCEDLTSVEWKSQELDEALRLRLSPIRYDLYLGTITEMHESMSEIAKILGVEDENVSA